MATKIGEVRGKALIKIRYPARTFMNRWVRRGGRLTTYFCPGCKTQRRTMRPAKRDVGRDGCWTSAKTCTRCGEIHHVSTWPSGKTLVQQLPEMQVATVNVKDLQLS